MNWANPIKPLFRVHSLGITGTALLVLLLCGCGGSSGNSTDEPSSPAISMSSSQYTSKSIRLSWNIPTTRVDGTPTSIAELGGYEIVYISANSGTSNVSISNPLTTSHTLTSLAPDNYRFLIFSYDTENRVSPASPEVTLPITSFRAP